MTLSGTEEDSSSSPPAQQPGVASAGRIVRVHLACRAPLPPGSTLRVTATHLWDPSTPCPPGDPADARAVSARTADDAYHCGISGFAGGSLGVGGTDVHEEGELEAVAGGVDGGVGVVRGGLVSTDGTALTSTTDGYGTSDPVRYASSVEMVTDPDSYPVWRTRVPVVLVVNDRRRPGGGGSNGNGDVSSSDGSNAVLMHHRYRYMVVTPGAADVPMTSSDPDLEGMMDEPPTTMGSFDSTEGGGGATTSDGMEGSWPVVAWEDPFRSVEQKDTEEEKEVEVEKEEAIGSRDTSIASVRSYRDRDGRDGGGGGGWLANLPYRTLDIDVATARVVGARGGDDDEEEVCFTNDGIRIDEWGNADDPTFRPYVVREAVNKQNRMLNEKLGTDETDMSESASEYGGNQPSIGMRIATDGGGIRTPSTPGSVTPPTNVPRKRIFFVCFHLPVIITRDESTGEWSACWAESLLARTEGSSVIRRLDAHWVGTVSANPPIVHEHDRDAVRSVLAAMDCTPLFLDSDVQKAHYLGMCKQVLWPAFHNIDLRDLSESGWAAAGGSDNGILAKDRNVPDDGHKSRLESNWDQSRLDGWWEAFQVVNRTFADALSRVIKPDDTVWVHDYHLALLPKLLCVKEAAEFGDRVTKKVFFLHIPFPTSLIFRELECGESILDGMLSADVVGFHSFDHARHFLNATKRILGLNYESLMGGLIGVKYRNKTVIVTMSNVSIEPRLVDAALALPSVQQGTAVLREKYGNRAVIAGIDIAQRLSGVSLKLLAFERLLMDYPIWKDKVVLVQKCLIPGSRRADEASTIREVRYLVRRIQEKFGQDVIDYEETLGSSLPIDQRLVLWKSAECFMNTTVREGLNLLPLEYVFARKEPAVPGVVIASEFSAVCSILNGALRVNPFDIQATVSTIDKVLSMDLMEREGRRIRDIEFVSSSPSDKWTKNVLRDLNDATNVSGTSDVTRSRDTSGGSRDQKGEKKRIVDNVASFLSREHDLAFSHLNADAVISAYKSTNRRVIIMDFNGTLVIKEAPGKYLKREILGTSGNRPPTAVIKALTTLCADPNNTVFVVSGDSQENVESAIGNIPRLGLAASNGACFSYPLRANQTERKWESFDLGVDWEAVKKVALPVLSKYTARTNGSFVKLTHSSLGWSYYSCDPEWGSLQASHLVLELEKELMAFDVRFVTLKGIVEVVPRKLNKGIVVKKVLRDVAGKNDGDGVDFVLCMGDDVSDEKMFTSVFSFFAEMDENCSNILPSPPIVGEKLVSSLSIIDESNLGKEPFVKYKNVDRPMYAFTAAVGKKATHASQYVDDARDVAGLLVRLSGDALPRVRSASWVMEETGTDLFA